MPLTQTEAAEALRDIDRTERRSSAIYGYRIGSPHLILWGLIWALGYGAMAVAPRFGLAWPALTLVGIAGSFVIGWRTRSTANAAFGWRYGATVVAICGFITALFLIMPPRSDLQVCAFFPLLVALAYSLIGIWSRGVRMLVTGIAVGALTLAGYFYLPEIFYAWMAVVGGGGLVAGGIWLRSA